MRQVFFVGNVPIIAFALNNVKIHLFSMATRSTAELARIPTDFGVREVGYTPGLVASNWAHPEKKKIIHARLPHMKILSVTYLELEAEL